MCADDSRYSVWVNRVMGFLDSAHGAGRVRIGRVRGRFGALIPDENVFRGTAAAIRWPEGPLCNHTRTTEADCNETAGRAQSTVRWRVVGHVRSPIAKAFADARSIAVAAARTEIFASISVCHFYVTSKSIFTDASERVGISCSMRLGNRRFGTRVGV